MLEKYHKEILTCTGCAFCKKACQIYFHTRNETDSPKGRIMISYGLLTGEIEEDESIVKALQKCALCRLCESVCPSRVKIGDIIKAARYDLKMILPEHQKLIDELNGWNEEINGKRIFIGELDSDAKEIAEKLNATPYAIGCGLEIERIGRENKLIEKIVDKIKKNGVEEVIYYEPQCKKYFEGINAKNILDFIESVDINEKFTLHIPYDYDGEFVEKVKEIFKGKKFELVRECCGAREEFKRAFEKEAEEMAKDIIKKSNGKIITTSLKCYEHLKKYGDVVDLLHIANFKVK